MFDDLIKELEKKGYEVFAYADDLAIVGLGIRKLKGVIKTTKRWSDRNGMKINEKKSGIVLHKGPQGRWEEDKTIDGIPVVKNYKYLGIEIDQELKMKA